jgi:hypothetical protein
LAIEVAEAISNRPFSEGVMPLLEAMVAAVAAMTQIIVVMPTHLIVAEAAAKEPVPTTSRVSVGELAST